VKAIESGKRVRVERLDKIQKTPSSWPLVTVGLVSPTAFRFDSVAGRGRRRVSSCLELRVRVPVRVEHKFDEIKYGGRNLEFEGGILGFRIGSHDSSCLYDQVQFRVGQDL